MSNEIFYATGRRKTSSARVYLKKEEVHRNWFVVDATDRVLGRVATKIADKIRGKDKPSFTPHTDGGDYVIVINAEKIKVTGSKFNNKIYYRHSLYPGGLKSQTFKELIEKNPERVIEEAVKGMLPKNKLGKSIIKKLKVFQGPNHDHESQQPAEWNPS
jgi:large subunit ribosomal protein L13